MSISPSGRNAFFWGAVNDRRGASEERFPPSVPRVIHFVHSTREVGAVPVKTQRSGGDRHRARLCFLAAHPGAGSNPVSGGFRASRRGQ